MNLLTQKIVFHSKNEQQDNTEFENNVFYTTDMDSVFISMELQYESEQIMSLNNDCVTAT